MSPLGAVAVAAEDPDREASSAAPDADTEQEIPDQTAEDIVSTTPVVEQRRAYYHAARQEARLERIRKARQAAPQAQMGAPQHQQVLPPQQTALDQNVSQSPYLPLVEPARAPGTLAEMHVSFILYQSDGPGSQTSERWSPHMSGVRQGAVTFEAKVEGRDGTGRPVDISPDWMPADPATVDVSPSRGNAVTITVRGEGASNVTVRALGISKDIWILATLDKRNAMRAEISQ
jgi:hypothetical protein